MIDVAGVGPGDIKYLTLEVYNAIKEYQTVLAFKRVKESLASLRDDIVEVSYGELKDYFNKDDILLLASGDPMFFGISDYLKREGALGRVYTGISSVQLLASIIKEPLSNANLLSAHGRELDYSKIKSNSYILTDNLNSPAMISKRLYENGMRGDIIVGFSLSYKDECIKYYKIGDNIEERSPLAVVYIRCEY
ncbi:MAG: precorrin-6y C5,15-methyltransferase (decarboxylating) subunit CbiE [Firmicutes bacterium]|nr:precorrin-6y C5,15-methyltransferase (decarboxylating) subunit CbiE [Bacillota bacterium]